MFLVQEVKHLDFVAVVPKDLGHPLVDFPLDIHQDHALPAAHGLKDEGLDKAPGLSGAGRAINHNVLRQPAAGLQCHIFSIFVIVVRVILLLAQDSPIQVLNGTGQQHLLLFLLSHKGRGAVRPVG